MLPLLFVVLLAGLLIGPLWAQSGLPNSADGILHLHRAAAMARAWSAGTLWPRWFPDVYQGLGAPVFHYYSPVFYSSVAALQQFGTPLDLSAKIVISVAFIASGLATWAWLRRLLTPTAGLVGAALYLSQPLLFREYYFQGDYPQLLALLWLPVVFWSFTRVSLEGRWHDWLLAPLSLAVLTMVHNITAMMGIGMLALYWCALVVWHRGQGGWWRGPAAALLAAGISAFFWLPALADSSIVRISNLQKGFFHFGQYFVQWRDLLAGPPVLDSRAANPPFPHLLGWAAWLALAAGALAVVVSFFRRSGWTSSRYWALIGLLLAALCLALTQPWSEPVWARFGFLALVEFPGRWLGPAALGVALAGGGAVAAYAEDRSWLPALGLILAVGLCSAVYLFPRHPFLQLPGFTGSDTQAYERESNVWGTTSGNEFLPRWADQSPPYAEREAEDRFLLPGAVWCWETPHRAVLQAGAGALLPVGPLVLPVHYFPAWEASADGSPLPVEPAAGGLVGVQLDQPAREIVLRWRGTFWQRVGQGISLSALLIWVACIALAARRRAGTTRQVPEVPSRSGWSQWLPLALLVVLIAGRVSIRALGLGWFQRDSPAGAVSHVAHPVDETLGGSGQPAMKLLGWDALPGSAKPGDELRLRLYWQVPAATEEDLHTFAQLHVPALRRSWAGVQNANPGRIPTSRWRPELYYVDDLTLSLPADIPPVTYTLAVGAVDDNGQRLAVPGNPDGLLFLDQVQVRPARPGRHQVLRPETSTPAKLGDSLWLQGYDLLWEAGGPVLRLYWQPLTKPSADWVVFIHVVDDQGKIVAQFDGPPLEGLLPTSQWEPGSLLIDRHNLWMAPELLGHSYRLLVGLYDPTTGARLKAVPKAGAEDHFDNDNALNIPFPVPPSP